MNRVVVTGLGIVSAIGNHVPAVLESLRSSRSGIVFMPEMEALGFKSCVFGPVTKLDVSGVRHKAKRTMSDCAMYAVVAALEAIEDAMLDPEALDAERTAVVVGTGGGGINGVPAAEQALRDTGSYAHLPPTGVARIMNSTAAGNLAAYLGVRGRVCSLSAACATGTFNIGHAYELLRYGLADLCLAGSSEEDTWRQVGLSADNGTAMPTGYNDRPDRACRPYDRDRQGFVLSSGAGILVMETLDRALQRGARVYAEIVGYGAASDADDMHNNSGVGLGHAMRAALASAATGGVDAIDFINAHGAGTVAGDQVEVGVIRSLFGDGPLVNSTKGISGHAMGATGSQEAVYTILMLHHGFVAPTVNLDHVAPECAGVNHVRTLYEGPLRTAMTLNSGLAGANACLILTKHR
jgi:3-oxoacyl-[acyl-carrier-protein] synthase-1